jgi:hypothetical protein
MKSYGYWLTMACIAFAAFMGCWKTYPQLDDIDMIPISTLQAIQGKEIIIEIIRGEEWEHTYRNGIWPVKVTPQFAIWSQDSTDYFIDTLYVTHKAAKQLWRTTPEKSSDETCYPEALPRWTYLRSHSGLTTPTRRMPLPDTITSATPSSNSVIYTRVQRILSEVWIVLEINLAHDGNDAFPENADRSGGMYTGASGQPALVYGVKVDLKKPGKYEMKLLGHSSPSGADGKINADVSGITTAGHIAKNIFVIYQGR